MSATTFSWSTLEEGLGAALAALLPAGAVIQWAEQDVPVRQLPRVELGWVSRAGAGQVETRLQPGGVDGQYLALERLQPVLQVDAYAASTRGAAGAMALADELHSAIPTQAAIDALAALGLAVIDRTPVRNVAALVDTKFEGRAQFELQLGLAKGQQQNLSWIESAETSGTYSGG